MTPTAGWAPFRPFDPTASVDWASPDLRLVDLDGDGLADVLITEDDAFTWYPWMSPTGFGAASTRGRPFDEDRGPALVFADSTDSIYLADMSGDGLADLVRIRNGEVCYWPNLGYGASGPRSRWTARRCSTTPTCSTQRRVRLADIDGSGTADLVYVGQDSVTDLVQPVGQRLDRRARAAAVPQRRPTTSQTSAFDLLGTGTACLVWTSPLPARHAVAAALHRPDRRREAATC